MYQVISTRVETTNRIKLLDKNIQETVIEKKMQSTGLRLLSLHQWLNDPHVVVGCDHKIAVQVAVQAEQKQKELDPAP
jgi:hypothetical protein